MVQWLRDCLDWAEQLAWWERLLIAGGLFLVTFVGSLAVVAWVLVKLPATYFQDDHHPAAFLWAERHPVLRWSARVAKNLLGLALIAAGIIMSIPPVPGQGLLTILIGIMLVDFPGRRRLEKKLVRWPRIRNAIDRLRQRFGKPPLLLDEEEQPPVPSDAGQPAESAADRT